MRHLVLILVAVFCAVGVASQVEAQTGPYSQVVDNATKGRFSADPNVWSTSAYSSQKQGTNYRFTKPRSALSTAKFKVKIPASGRYTVYGWWPANSGYNDRVVFRIYTVNGWISRIVNQRINGGRWVSLGAYAMPAGDANRIQVSNRSAGKGHIIADAVKVVQATAPAARHPDSLLGAPIYSQTRVQRYARSVSATRYIMETIPHYYTLAPKTGIAPDVLVAQAMLETGNGHYGGASRPWNMAGIKKSGAVGDGSGDFERPATAYEGARMHVNHMAAYAGKKPIGTPHARYYDARAAQKNRGWWVSRVSQLGNGVWATDPYYASKIRRILDNMAKY